MLNRLSNAFVAATLVLASFVLNAQSIDLGRGELPVTVPAGYSSENPTPLIVLLHGYTSSGAMQDNYMGFSKLADQYGFLLVAPDGNREPGGDQNRFWNASDACCDFFSTEVDDSAYIADIIDDELVMMDDKNAQESDRRKLNNMVFHAGNKSIKKIKSAIKSERKNVKIKSK